MSRHNIVVIFTDQQRWDTLGCYGNSAPVSPNLDQFATQGVKFQYAFTPQPVCGPARSCLQTGQYATEIGCYRNGIALPTDIPTIAKLLQKKGYQTGYVGKWHLASTILPSCESIGPHQDYQRSAIPEKYRGGFTGFYRTADVLEHTSDGYGGYLFDEHNQKLEFQQYRVDAMTDYALDFFNHIDPTSPFFLFVSYLEPHHQNNHKAFESPPEDREKFVNSPIPLDLKAQNGDWEKHWADYLGCCHAIDRNVQRLVDYLQDHNLLEDTVFIFTSDHGCHFRTRTWEYKRSCHEASIHIPLLIRGPGFPPNITYNGIVNLMDVSSTILRAAALPNPPQMHGTPLQELLQSKSLEKPSECFIQISESQVGRVLRTTRWKYAIKAPFRNGFLWAKSPVYIEECLYDLKNDPYELHNLIKNSDYKLIRRELQQKLSNYILKIEKYVPRIISPVSWWKQLWLRVKYRKYIDVQT